MILLLFHLIMSALYIVTDYMNLSTTHWKTVIYIYEIVTILQWVQTSSLSWYWFLVRKESKNCRLDHVLLLLLLLLVFSSFLPKECFIPVCAFSVHFHLLLCLCVWCANNDWTCIYIYLWLACSLLHYICIAYATRSNTLRREFAITLCREVRVTATAQWSS